MNKNLSEVSMSRDQLINQIEKLHDDNEIYQYYGRPVSGGAKFYKPFYDALNKYVPGVNYDIRIGLDKMPLNELNYWYNYFKNAQDKIKEVDKFKKGSIKKIDERKERIETLKDTMDEVMYYIQSWKKHIEDTTDENLDEIEDIFSYCLGSIKEI